MDRVVPALVPAVVTAFLMAAIFIPVLIIVREEEDPGPRSLYEITETFWKFSKHSPEKGNAPFNATVCIVYEEPTAGEGNDTTTAPKCSRAPLNPSEFTKVADYFMAHAECRTPYRQTLIEGKCRVLERHPHSVKPELIMHGRHHGSMFCQWFVGRKIRELIVSVEATCSF